MGSIGEVSGTLSLEDRLSSVLNNAEKNLGQFDNSMKNVDKTLGDLDRKFEERTGALQSFGETFKAVFSANVAAELFAGAISSVVNVTKDLVSWLPRVALEGAGIGDVADNFDNLATGAGRLGKELLGALREGTHNTITDFELMKVVNKDLQSGLNLSAEEFKTLSKGAFALAQATGGDVASSFETMNSAMMRGVTRTVEMQFGKINLEKAERKYAESINASGRALTAEENLQMRRMAILDKVSESTQRLGEQTDGLDEFMAQAETAWANFREELGRTIASSPTVIALFEGIRDAVMYAFGSNQEQLIEDVGKAIDALAKRIPDLMDYVVDLGLRVAQVFDDMRNRAGGVGEALRHITVGASAGAAMGAFGGGIGAVPGALIGGTVGAFLPTGSGGNGDPSEVMNALTAAANKSHEAINKIRQRMSQVNDIKWEGPQQQVGNLTTGTEKFGAALEQAKKEAEQLQEQMFALERSSLSTDAALTRALEKAAVRRLDPPQLSEMVNPQRLAGAWDEASSVLTGRPLIPTINLQPAKMEFQSFADDIGRSFNTAVQGFPNLVQQALTGGGGMKGAVKAFGSMFGSSIGEDLFNAGGPLNKIGGKLAGIFGDGFGLALPGIGAALGALVGPAMAKLWDGLKKLFGGPSEAELSGRAIESKFELDAGGFEAMANKIGDAYAAMGRTREQAQVDIKAMLDSEKQGPEAVQAWVDKFGNLFTEVAKMRESDAAAAADLDAQTKSAATKRFQDAQTELSALVSQRDALVKGIASEAPEEVMGVIETQMRGQLGVLDAQIEQRAAAYEKLAQESGQQMAQAIMDALRDIKLDPIRVPVVLDGLPNGESPETPTTQAAGGSGVAMSPTLFMVGERGPEPYAFGGAFGNNMDAFGDGSGVSDALASMAATIASLPRIMKAATRDAAQEARAMA